MPSRRISARLVIPFSSPNLSIFSFVDPPFPQPIEDSTQPLKAKESLIKYVKPKVTAAKSENKILTSSDSGSFSYEVNKILFVSGLVQNMEKHNMTMPENLLDETDFVPKLLEFLGQYNINLPTENIPQFHIDSVSK